jgi:hypothetical protein
MFIRLVITLIDDVSHKPQGLFVAAHDLLDSSILSLDERNQIQEALIWFNKNLPSPRWQYANRAIFWFKSSAEESVRRMWELANLLRVHGYHIELQKCRELGNIVYEDEYQVAAYPSMNDKR